MELEAILFNKEDLQFSRIETNNYKLMFSMENSNIILSKIINFELIQMIYSLNPDVYEKVELEKNGNDTEAVITLVMKHFFEDLGLVQRFSFLRIKKIIEENRILFVGQSIKSYRPSGIPEKSELMSLENMTVVCDIITPHKIQFSINILFDKSMNIPTFVEKVVGVILFKIFKRVKHFVENV